MEVSILICPATLVGPYFPSDLRFSLRILPANSSSRRMGNAIAQHPVPSQPPGSLFTSIPVPPLLVPGYILPDLSISVANGQFHVGPNHYIHHHNRSSNDSNQFAVRDDSHLSAFRRQHRQRRRPHRRR